MRVVTPKHIAAQVQDWTVAEGGTKVGVSRTASLSVLDALWECDKRNTRIVWPKTGTIAEARGLSRRTVVRALRSLQVQGFIVPLSSRHGGHGVPTTWGLVDNPTTVPSRHSNSDEEVCHDGKEVCRGVQRTVPSRPTTVPSRHTQGRKNEERKEERMKSEHPLRLVDPPEPPRACRMPGCERPALVGSRCLRHASGLPFPLPTPADGVPQRPERHEESA